MKHTVRGCVETTSFGKSKGRITIDTVIESVPDDKADFFGVYQIGDDGLESWIADFMRWDDAQMFALEKGKEETK